MKPQFPSSAPTADQWIEYAVTDGLFAEGLHSALMDAGASDPQHPLFGRYHETLLRIIHDFDTVKSIRAVQALDPAAADALAADVWLAAWAGDSYGEWLWEWGEGLGLLPQSWFDAGREVAAEAVAKSRDETEEIDRTGPVV